MKPSHLASSELERHRARRPPTSSATVSAGRHDHDPVLFILRGAPWFWLPWLQFYESQMDYVLREPLIAPPASSYNIDILSSTGTAVAWLASYKSVRSSPKDSSAVPLDLYAE